MSPLNFWHLVSSEVFKVQENVWAALISFRQMQTVLTARSLNKVDSVLDQQ